MIASRSEHRTSHKAPSSRYTGSRSKRARTKDLSGNVVSGSMVSALSFRIASELHFGNTPQFTATICDGHLDDDLFLTYVVVTRLYGDHKITSHLKNSLARRESAKQLRQQDHIVRYEAGPNVAAEATEIQVGQRAKPLDSSQIDRPILENKRACSPPRRLWLPKRW